MRAVGHDDVPQLLPLIETSTRVRARARSPEMRKNMRDYCVLLAFVVRGGMYKYNLITG